jgi:Mrp family chromosome partitioning ATPase
VILVDSPPVLEFPDAQVIAARTGGCLLVTKQNETRLADIEAVTNVLAPTGAQMIGAVIQR